MTVSLPGGICTSLTSEKRATLTEQTNLTLLKIARANFNSQYASQTSTLAEFRDAVSTHDGTENDGDFLQDFRTHVPLSDYQSYKPFIAKFDSQPCKEYEVENLFAPGFPSFLAVSSATSGGAPKLLPKYYHTEQAPLLRTSLRDPNSQDPTAAVIFSGYRELKQLEREPGQLVRRIPVCMVSAGVMRRMHGWNLDNDENRLSALVPGYVAPWAATLIGHQRSFLMIHALFFLACRDLNRVIITFSTLFVDLIRHIDEEWDMFLSCVRDGKIPDLEGINHVRLHLQAHLCASPDRAAELREIGPPSSCEGWAARVWPKLGMLMTICSGPFATVLPKMKAVLGPSISIRCSGYGASEAIVGVSYRGDNDTFILQTDDIIEFLDVSVDESHKNIRQPWELEPGKQYEIILTTKDGLWRYRLGDVVEIVGFDVEKGSPLFHYSGRRSLVIRFPHTQIMDGHLLAAIQAISSEDVLPVQEFTAMVDDRRIPTTVGFFVELSGPLGPNSSLALQKLFEALVITNVEHERAVKFGQMGLPTIRLVKPGTFAEYRRWKGDKIVKAGAGQIKLPVILLDPVAQEWILERVAGEL